MPSIEYVCEHEWYEYASYVMETVGPSTDGLFGTGEALEKLKNDGFGEIVITFDNNDNINSLDFSMQVFGGAGNEIYPNNVTISFHCHFCSLAMFVLILNRS